MALLESRMSGELARLVEKHGGVPLCVPAVRERRELDDAAAERLLEGISSGAHEIVVFMTGVAVSILFDIAEGRGRRPGLVSALRRITTVCRGPKPTAALRGFGVVPTFTARDSFTSAEVIDALSSIDLKDKRVLLFHYGERSDTLAETLIARQAVLDEQWLYRWELPEDTADLDRLVVAIVRGDVDALAITCQIQFRHLHAIANRMGQARDLVDALNGNVVVGAVGPTCHAVLRVHGVRVDVVPEHPKMGPLIVALMRHLERKSGPRSAVGDT